MRKTKMKFKLGQKVKYKRISKKIEIDMQFWTPDDFERYDEEKELVRREFVELKNERIGYVMGRRKLVVKTYFGVERDSGDNFEPATEWVEIKKQDWKYFYLIACGMNHIDYVLEQDLSEVADEENSALAKLAAIKYDDNYKRLREKLIVDVLQNLNKKIECNQYKLQNFKDFVYKNMRDTIIVNDVKK